jgi:hypothetical protein
MKRHFSGGSLENRAFYPVCAGGPFSHGFFQEARGNMLKSVLWAGVFFCMLREQPGAAGN